LDPIDKNYYATNLLVGRPMNGMEEFAIQFSFKKKKITVVDLVMATIKMSVSGLKKLIFVFYNDGLFAIHTFYYSPDLFRHIIEDFQLAFCFDEEEKKNNNEFEERKKRTDEFFAKFQKLNLFFDGFLQ